jgi:hypothetical protein
MEQFFVILAIAVFWAIRGSAEARKRRQHREERAEIDWEPFSEGEGAGQQALEASIEDIEDRARRGAAEALRRWGARPEMREEQAEAAMPVRLRPDLPSGAEAKRTDLREALRSLAANLPVEAAGAPERLPVRRESRAVEVQDRSQSALVDPPRTRAREPYGRRSREPYGRSSEPYGRSSEPYGRSSEPYGRSRSDRSGQEAGSVFQRLERLPPLQRAIVFGEVFGPPVALRDRPPGSGSGS